MTTVSAHLDRIQDVLNDDGTIWSRAELLDWFRDGYRQLAESSRSARTLQAYDLPPRHTFAYSYDWEARHLKGGTGRKFTYSHNSSQMESTSLWEAESVKDVTPDVGFANVTQLWEIAHAGQVVDQHFRVYFARSHSQVLAVWFDQKHLEPISVRELDGLEDAWWRINGEPYYWTRGLGRDRTIEIYEIDTTYQQSYSLGGTYPRGIPRQFSGSRTYTVVKPDDATLAVGVMRRITSPNRQYFPTFQWQNKGTARAFASSENNLLVWSVVLPQEPDLTEDSTIDMFPDQLGKYLRYYVLSVAFNRQGEGYDGIMAAHYQQRWDRAVILMRRLAGVLHRDEEFQRQPRERIRRQVPLPQLPSDFPQITFGRK